MTVSTIVPIYDKPAETIQAVLRGVNAQAADQTIVVLDRTPAPIAALLDGMYETVRLDGPPGWRSPCIAANAGLARVTGDITIYNPSDIVQSDGNIARLKEMMQERAVYFAKVIESKPEDCMGIGHAGPVLCSSDNPRALTFLIAVPTDALKAIGGWDEAFQDGVCYEDDDLTARLWKHGLDFIFDDRFSGIHQSHSRAYFQPIRTLPNQNHMLRKHGTLQFFNRQAALKKLESIRNPGRTEWRHS